jgi:hypothetical protein
MEAELHAFWASAEVSATCQSSPWVRPGAHLDAGQNSEDRPNVGNRTRFYGSTDRSLIATRTRIQGVSRRELQRYSKRYCVASVTQNFRLKGVQTTHHPNPLQ